MSELSDEPASLGPGFVAAEVCSGGRDCGAGGSGGGHLGAGGRWPCGWQPKGHLNGMDIWPCG